MSAISDSIAAFIQSLLIESDSVELKRNELAQYFGCAPSQINYVLSTRFTIERGYRIVSKRGGGGYIHVNRIHQEDMEIREMVTNQIGQEISLSKAKSLIDGLLNRESISAREAALMEAAVSEMAMIPTQVRDYVRANTLKQMVCALFQCIPCQEEACSDDM